MLRANNWNIHDIGVELQSISSSPIIGAGWGNYVMQFRRTLSIIYSVKYRKARYFTFNVLQLHF